MPQTLLQKLHPYVEALIPGHSLLQLKRALHTSGCFSAHWHIKSSLPPLITLWYRVIQTWIQRGSWRYREVKWPAQGQMRGPWQRWGKTHSQNSGCLIGCLVSGHLAPQGAKDAGRQDEASRADFTDSGALPWTGFQASVDFEEPRSAWSETLACSLRDYSVEVGFKDGQSHFTDIPCSDT